MYYISGVNISTKYFCFSQIGIYILKMHLSTCNLDYMIPKGISHTSFQKPTYEFQKRNISSIHENISSIQNYTVILAGHFYWFGRFVPSTGILTWTALWEHCVSREPRKRRPTRCRFPCRVDSAGPVSPTCN